MEKSCTALLPNKCGCIYKLSRDVRVKLDEVTDQLVVSQGTCLSTPRHWLKGSPWRRVNTAHVIISAINCSSHTASLSNITKFHFYTSARPQWPAQGLYFQPVCSSFRPSVGNGRYQTEATNELILLKIGTSVLQSKGMKLSTFGVGRSTQKSRSHSAKIGHKIPFCQVSQERSNTFLTKPGRHIWQ